MTGQHTLTRQPEVAGHFPVTGQRTAAWRRPLRLPAGWPLTALFVGYPLWWALGLPTFIFGLLAIPMAVELYRRGGVRVPAGFGVWLVLLAWVLLSGLTLDLVPTGTLAPSGTGRYIGWLTRVGNYTALTVLMLYVLNLPERTFSRRRVIRLLGFMAVVTVIGGYVGTLLPSLSFTAPLAYLLPPSVAADPFVARLMAVDVAQVQEVLPGEVATARASAPFEYTNTWGENIAILLVWLVVGWIAMGGRVRRLAGYGMLVAAIVPIVASLNRGLWLGLAIAVVYLAVRLALHGRMAFLAGIALAVGALGVLIVVSPLGGTLTDRVANGHSDTIRATLNDGAWRAALESPVLGFGANRALAGSGRSIAIGKSEECPQCGNREIGSDGQFWHLLVAQGLIGTLCYNAFFLWSLWRYRHDHSAAGIAGSTVLILLLFFQFLYGSLNTTLAFGLVSVALLARNQLHRPWARRTPVRVLGRGTG